MSSESGSSGKGKAPFKNAQITIFGQINPLYVSSSLPSLIEQTEAIARKAIQNEDQLAGLIQTVHPNNRESARNLIHYLTIRSYNLRELQDHLASLGISAFGHAEAYSLANLFNIHRLLCLLDGREMTDFGPVSPPVSFNESLSLLAENKRVLFGSEKKTSRSKIMVTMPTEAAEEPRLIQSLVLAGMNIARINLSHDNPEAWLQMVRNVRKAEETTNRPCLVYMDLSGPKLRTKIPLRMGKKKKKDSIKVHEGDLIKVGFGPIADVKPTPSEKHLTAIISSTLKEAFKDIQVGERIFFDDGKIGGRVVDVQEEAIIVRIDQAAITGSKLKSEKGINLPDTQLNMPSLTAFDIQNLPFVAEHADIVGYSFLRTPKDVEMLQFELSKLNRSDIGIVLKIETEETFQNLGKILLTAMRSPAVGVMIARGDLAVEMGFERIAEVQEEILWLCEAAHIPGIWATQVLENLAKKGQPSRAEITDAAMAGRAECVMLNKGPYIVNAVGTLEDILNRMQEHQVKRKGSLRTLGVAKHFFNK